jgi:hypothetical protein
MVLKYPQTGLENRQDIPGIVRVTARGAQQFYPRALVGNDLAGSGEMLFSPSNGVIIHAPTIAHATAGNGRRNDAVCPAPRPPSADLSQDDALAAADPSEPQRNGSQLSNFSTTSAPIVTPLWRPIILTKNGRDRLVLISAEKYDAAARLRCFPTHPPQNSSTDGARIARNE